MGGQRGRTYAHALKRRLHLAADSSDGGNTFHKLLDLETEPGEYSYPSVIYHGGILRGTYTWRREKIVYFEAEV